MRVDAKRRAGHQRDLILAVLNLEQARVRGQHRIDGVHRIPYTPEQATTAAAEKPAASSWTRHYLTGLAIGLGAVAVIGGSYFLVRRVRHA